MKTCPACSAENTDEATACASCGAPMTAPAGGDQPAGGDTGAGGGDMPAAGGM